MRKIAVVPLLLLSSCWMFRGTNFEPAIQANAAQKMTFEQHSNAFERIIIESNASQEVKSKILAAIQADRSDFYSFNAALQSFLMTAGDVDANKLVDIAIKGYEKFKEKAVTTK